MTWARYNRPNSQKKISQTYSMAAKNAGAQLAPVGTAWENALKTAFETVNKGC